VASPAYWASTGWKRAATSLCAIVAGGLRNSSQELWTGAAGRLQDSAEYLRPIVAAYLRQSSRSLRATAERYRRQSTEYLYPLVAFYLGQSSRYLRATVARRWRRSSEYLRTAAARLGKSSKIEIAIVAAIAIVSGLGGFAVTTAFLQRPTRPAPVVAAQETPPQPKPSWVTDYEIQRAQKLGRLLLDISPAELLAMYERNGSDAIEAYRDGWVKIDYPIMSFDRQTFGKIPYDVVEAAAHFHSVFPGKIIAVFNAQKWGALLHMHRTGDQIVAFCKFKDIEREEVLTNIHRLWFYGTGCDLPQLLESTNTTTLR
jgi:hypothetical protein